MLTDALFDRLVRRLKRNRHQQYGEPSSTSSRMKKGEPTLFCSDYNACKRSCLSCAEPQGGQRGFGTLNGAHGFVMNQPTFVERSQIIQTFMTGKPGK